MSNALWRSGDDLQAYTDSTETMRKIRRSYPDFVISAWYYREGKLIALQYRVPYARRNVIRRLLGGIPIEK